MSIRCEKESRSKERMGKREGNKMKLKKKNKKKKKNNSVLLKETRLYETEAG